MFLRNSLILFFILNFLLSGAQSWTWSTTKYYNGRFPRHVQKDHNGDLYLVRWGYLNGNDLDTIIKMTTMGSDLFAIPIPAGMEVEGLAITSDNGFFAGGICTGIRSTGSYTYAAQASDMWVARYDSVGTLLWFKTYGSKGSDYLADLCTKGNDLVITGELGDTTNFDGQVVPKAATQELFVAILTGSGSYVMSKVAVNTATQCAWSTTPCLAYSRGFECETDAAGNVYILTYAEGKTQIDTFLLSTWSLQYQQTQNPGCNRCVLKLNSSLQIQTVTRFPPCISNYTDCGVYNSLIVSGSGNAYVLFHNMPPDYFNYGEWTEIYHINNTGVVADTFRLHPPGKDSEIMDLDIDSCENIYYTGYSRYNNYNYDYVLSTGQLSPSLKLHWMVEDSAAGSAKYCGWFNLWTGRTVVALRPNDCFVGGTFSGTVQLAYTHSVGCTQTTQFYARLTGQQLTSCAQGLVGVFENRNVFGQHMYPNPTTGEIILKKSLNKGTVVLRNNHGQVVFIKEGVDTKVSIEHLPDGLYLVTLIVDGQTQSTSKIIVTH